MSRRSSESRSRRSRARRRHQRAAQLAPRAVVRRDQGKHDHRREAASLRVHRGARAREEDAVRLARRVRLHERVLHRLFSRDVRRRFYRGDRAAFSPPRSRSSRSLFQLHLLALIPGILVRRRSVELDHPSLSRDPDPARRADGHGHRAHARGPRRDQVAVVVMGRAHVQGYERLLVDRHGFTRVDD